MFYQYRQNNSGGSFVFEKDRLSVYVIVEAETLQVANARAEAVGVYFNGCETGQDCSCCGDRWYEPWASDASDTPQVYDMKVESGQSMPTDSIMMHKWMKAGQPEGYIHYADGRVEEFWAT